MVGWFFRRNALHWVLRGLLTDVWFQDEPVLRAVRNLVGGSRALAQLDQYQPCFCGRYPGSCMYLHTSSLIMLGT
jgi:hypothetical protein